jgi:hypothetical protein
MELDVHGSVHHSTIHKEKIQQDATIYQTFIIPYLYKAQHVSGDTPPIIRRVKLHWQPLVFHTWQVVWTCSWWTLSGTLCLTTYQCSFILLMMGGVSPETC